MIRTAVITAGGTSEPIDDVRVVTNLSTGRFGAQLANALAEAGVRVTLLASHALASHPEWVHPEVDLVPFGAFTDLRRALHAACDDRPDLVLMAAAVSDYAPV
ncbi:MAG: phosphopantothenoylcysteine decarboxylase/phosphopantothenate--cysteine ligase, partial [Myxococcota bacterium]